MNKFTHKKSKQINLLKEQEFTSFIKLQASHVIAYTGGISPWYLPKAQQQRLVNGINILKENELQQIAYKGYLGTN